jgi:hypothetical protein
MSIANDYLNCADWVAGRAHRLEPIMPSEAAHLAMELLKLADQAKRMERLAIVFEPVVYSDKDDCDAVL